MKQQELLDKARKAVRRYADGIKSPEDRNRQMAYEDALVAWILGEVSEVEKRLALEVEQGANQILLMRALKDEALKKLLELESKASQYIDALERVVRIAARIYGENWREGDEICAIIAKVHPKILSKEFDEAQQGCSVTCSCQRNDGTTCDSTCPCECHEPGLRKYRAIACPTCEAAVGVGCSADSESFTHGPRIRAWKSQKDWLDREASLLNTINQELRENGPANVIQAKPGENLRLYVRNLVDLVKDKLRS